MCWCPFPPGALVARLSTDLCVSKCVCVRACAWGGGAGAFGWRLFWCMPQDPDTLRFVGRCLTDNISDWQKFAPLPDNSSGGCDIVYGADATDPSNLDIYTNAWTPYPSAAAPAVHLLFPSMYAHRLVCGRGWLWWREGMFKGRGQGGQVWKLRAGRCDGVRLRACACGGDGGRPNERPLVLCGQPQAYRRGSLCWVVLVRCQVVHRPSTEARGSR